MKVKLFYIHPNNYGNLMMACAFVTNFSKYYFNKTGKRAEFYLDVLDDIELKRVKDSLEEGILIYREKLYNRKRRGILGKLEKAYYIPKEIKYNQKEYDICVVLGGDCISQYYSKQVFISDMIKFHGIAGKMPFYLLGQTMGPFTGYAIKLVGWALRNANVYVRDNDCYAYLQDKFSFKQLFEARDLAFLDIPYQNDDNKKSNVMEQYMGKASYITVVASGADRQYTSNVENYIQEYCKIIKKIINETEYDVLLLAHVIHVADSNDKRIIDCITKRLGEVYLKRVHIVNSLLLPYEARILIGRSQATITGRMHAAVSSINMGTVPICLSYSVKFKGVIGDDFGLNKYICQCRGDEKWKNGQVSEEIWNMLQDVLENRKEILMRLKNRLKDVQDKAINQIIELGENF